MEKRIGNAIADEFEACFKTLEEAIEACGESEWRSGDNFQFIPSRLALHAIETVAYGMRPSPEGFPFGQRFGDWELLKREELPSREDVRTYMKEVREEILDRLERTSDESFIEVEMAFRKTGWTMLGRMIYILRHAQHHVGQIIEECRRRGLTEPRWH